MILKSPVSRLSLVNLFADFILNQIPKEEESIIQVVDCFNFYVIKGKTTYNEPLNIGKLKDEFIIKFEDLIGEVKLTHIIDLIEYDSKLKPSESLTFAYHNTNNCSYHNSQIKSFEEDSTVSYDYRHFLKPITESNNLIFCSEFPHGYSLNQGRLLYYYGKHIAYNFTDSITEPKISLTLTNSHSEEDKLISVFGDNPYPDEKLKSYLLDMFDFNYEKLNEEIKKVDLSLEITNPLEDFECLKKKIKLDLFI